MVGSSKKDTMLPQYFWKQRQRRWSIFNSWNQGLLFRSEQISSVLNSPRAVPWERIGIQKFYKRWEKVREKRESRAWIRWEGKWSRGKYALLEQWKSEITSSEVVVGKEVMAVWGWAGRMPNSGQAGIKAHIQTILKIKIIESLSR